MTEKNGWIPPQNGGYSAIEKCDQAFKELKKTIDVFTSYQIETNHCDCHPETCQCQNFKIIFCGEKIATGGNYEKLKKLVDLANR